MQYELVKVVKFLCVIGMVVQSVFDYYVIVEDCVLINVDLNIRKKDRI